MRVERALLVAAGLATGCTPRPALDVWVPKVAAPQMCAPRAEDPRAAAVLAAFPPGLEGDVRLVSLRGDDRLQHAGHGVARWSHDGRALVTATGRALIVWDPVSGAPKHTVSLGQGRAVVVDMAVSRTGAQVALVTSRREGPGNMATSRLLVVRPRRRPGWLRK